MSLQLPSIKRLREVLAYDPDTGSLTWQVKTAARISVGDQVTYSCRGYICVRVDGHLMRANRVIFAMQTGRWPAGFVDHEDLDPSNNRWSNLREATRSQNGANSAPRNKLGIKGVYPLRDKFQAKITFHRKVIHLGTFTTATEAHAAYVAKAKELYGKFARAA